MDERALSGPSVLGAAMTGVWTTIVGVATGSPDGGVAIVRLSGTQACTVARQLCAGPLGPVRQLVRRTLQVRSGSEQALVVWMAAPHSFTGEDVVELHVHGGRLSVEEVVGACIERGATPAGRGEFSRRAFENGRLSLEQAEGIAAVIGARTEAELGLARRLSGGELGRATETLIDRLRTVLVHVVAYFDFPDDMEDNPPGAWADELRSIAGALRDWQTRFEIARRHRSRPRVVLGGPPNAGKSALFNALLGRERALVADVPGTTRDFLEAELDVGGVVCVLVDTAGMRETADVIEALGVERSSEQFEQADMVIWLEAADAEPFSGRRPRGDRTLEVESKRDLGAQRDWLGVSTRSGVGQDAITEWIRAWFVGGGEAPWIGLERHRTCAVEAAAAVDTALAALQDESVGAEVVAFDLEQAIRRLEAIRGRSEVGPVGEDVLRAVFSQFCIGK